jgi:hypothetical protein
MGQCEENSLIIVFTLYELSMKIEAGIANIMRRFLPQRAINLIEKETDAKGGTKAKRLQTGCNEEYLLNILSGG